MTAMPVYSGRERFVNLGDRDHPIRSQAGSERDADHRPIPVGGQEGCIGHGLRFLRHGASINPMCSEGAEHTSPSAPGGGVGREGAQTDAHVLSGYYSVPLPRGGGAGGRRAAHRIHGPCPQNLTRKKFCLETSFSLLGKRKEPKKTRDIYLLLYIDIQLLL